MEELERLVRLSRRLRVYVDDIRGADAKNGSQGERSTHEDDADERD